MGRFERKTLEEKDKIEKLRGQQNRTGTPRYAKSQKRNCSPSRKIQTTAVGRCLNLEMHEELMRFKGSIV